MTQEQKAKAYDEALEYAHYLINERCKEGTDGSFHRADLQKMFSELKESEDAKIRKAILNYMTKMWGNSQDDVCGVHVEDAIAWLKKQGEKPFDYEDANIRQKDYALNIKAKFKVGDWVVISTSDGEKVVRIDSIEML